MAAFLYLGGALVALAAAVAAILRVRAVGMNGWLVGWCSRPLRRCS